MALESAGARNVGYKINLARIPTAPMKNTGLICGIQAAYRGVFCSHMAMEPANRQPVPPDFSVFYQGSRW